MEFSSLSRLFKKSDDEARKLREREMKNLEIVRSVYFGYNPSFFANAEHTKKKELYNVFRKINTWLDSILKEVSAMPHIPFSDDLVDPDKILPSGLRYLLADGVPSEMDQFRVKLGQNGLNGEKVFVPVIATPTSRMDRFADKKRHFAYPDFDAFDRFFPENKKPKKLYQTEEELEEDLRCFFLHWYIHNCEDAHFFPNKEMEITLPTQNPNDVSFPMPDDVPKNEFHALDKHHLFTILEIPAGSVDPKKPLCKY